MFALFSSRGFDGLKLSTPSPFLFFPVLLIFVKGSFDPYLFYGEEEAGKELELRQLLFHLCHMSCICSGL